MRDRWIKIVNRVLKDNFEHVSLDVAMNVADCLIEEGAILVDTNMVDCVTNRKPIQTALGMPLDELSDLIRAKQDERIITPPCKIGDRVYFYKAELDEICPAKAIKICNNFYTPSMPLWITIEYDSKLIGKQTCEMASDVFKLLCHHTKEEAEKALKGGAEMKSVLIGIQPEGCELISNGKKTIEVRKTKPKIETPFKCYIYCTQGEMLLKTINNSLFIDKSYNDRENLYGVCEKANGKVIGEFVCDDIFPIRVFENGSIQEYVCHSMERSCVPYDDISNYIGKDKTGYGWHISDVVIYDEPKELSEFKMVGCKGCRDKDTYHCKFHCIGERRIKRPPQSWCYVEKGSVE